MITRFRPSGIGHVHDSDTTPGTCPICLSYVDQGADPCEDIVLHPVEDSKLWLDTVNAFLYLTLPSRSE